MEAYVNLIQIRCIMVRTMEEAVHKGHKEENDKPVKGFKNIFDL
jgi:hypothetical protein